MTPTINGLESITRVSTLGFALVDAASRRRVGDGLEVQAAVPEDLRSTLPATCSKSGVWHFDGLPGMSEAERGTGDELYWMQPRREFVVTVVDRVGRYLPCQFLAQAPTRGLFLPACIAGEYSPLAPAGIPLYAGPGALGIAGLAIARAELTLAATGAPAKRAVVEILFGREPLGRGVADDDGRVMVVMNYPALQSFSSGPILTSGTGRALSDQTWKVRVVVRYSAAASETDLPDICTVLAQPEVPVWASTDFSGSFPEQDLVFGRELTMQSIDAVRHTRSPQLWVGNRP